MIASFRPTDTMGSSYHKTVTVNGRSLVTEKRASSSHKHSTSGMKGSSMKKLNPVIEGRVSDELYDKSIGKLNANPMAYSLEYKIRIIHLIDSVSRGYTTPGEAYEALEAPYFPSWLELRESAYEHLIK